MPTKRVAIKPIKVDHKMYTQTTDFSDPSKVRPDPLLIDEASIVDGDKRERIRVLMTRNPQDFWHMYTKGPLSCMSYGEGMRHQWMQKFKLHPMSSLAFHDHIKGLYVKDSTDRTLFRALVYSLKPVPIENLEKGKWSVWRQYWLSTIGAATVTALGGYLADLGFDGRTYTGGVWQPNDYKVTIKPIKLDVTDKAFIVPYFDNHPFTCSMKWNATDKVWEFEYHAGKEGNYRNKVYQAAAQGAGGLARLLTPEHMKTLR